MATDAEDEGSGWMNGVVHRATSLETMRQNSSGAAPSVVMHRVKP